MKKYILIDEQNICRCIATEECNLHKDKLHMKKLLVEGDLMVGDEVDLVDDSGKVARVKVTPRPENYPQPSEDEIREQKIRAEMRRMAEERLITRGEIKVI